MKLRRDSRGAVSVFLIIILVPCIFISSIFVDISRVHLSRSMAQSAGDLALNTLMTNYDADLSDWYGMAASCQSIEEFYEGSAQFFLRTISSQGLSEDEIKTVASYYAAATDDDTIYDLLQVELMTAPSEMIKAVDGANLTNATMLKKQVVEFMKYRAPIELATSLFERWKANSGDLKAAEESKKNEELTETKTSYYEAESDLLGAALKSYRAIYKYYYAVKSENFNNELLKKYAGNLTTYKTAYEEIHNIYIPNLSNTSDLAVYNRVAYSLDKYNDSYPKDGIGGYFYTKEKNDVITYYFDLSKAEDLYTDLENKVKMFKTAKTQFETNEDAVALMGKELGNASEQINEIQWWVHMNKAVNASKGHTEELKLAGEEMLKTYSQVLAIDKCELSGEAEDGWDSIYDELIKEVETLQAKYLVADVTDTDDMYLKMVSKLEEVSEKNINNISASVLKLENEIDGSTKTVNDAIVYINSRLVAMRSELQGYVDLLNVAINGKKKEVESLDKLTELANKYSTSFEEWKSKAYDTDTELGKEDVKSIEGTCEKAEDNVSKEAQEINGGAVNALKTRLENIKSQLVTVIDAIDSLKYGDTKLTSITCYDDFVKAAKKDVKSSDIGMTNGELSTYAADTLSKLIAPNKEKVLTLTNMENADYNPLIDPNTKDIETPELFVYMHNKFKDVENDTVEEKQSEIDQGNAQGEEEKKRAARGRYHGMGESVKNDFSDPGTFSLWTDLFSSVKGLIGKLDAPSSIATGMRDDLYLTTYIMNMFSYATYEEEGLYSLVENKTELKLPSSGHRPDGYKDYLEAWKSDKVTDPYNKSLTNKLINKDNNAAYLAEIEYILYGGDNESNVKAAYGDIYTIRYVLNLAAGFKHFWSISTITGKAINYVANFIQNVTCCIIPAPLTKLVLIPILAIFETSKDLDRLEAGFPVELFKMKDTQWWCALSSEGAKSIGDIIGGLKGDRNNTGEGLFYSDYLTMFVYIGLQGTNSQAMCQRMGEVIQENMRKLTKKTDYSLKESVLYFELNAKLRVDPLLGTLPLFVNNGYNMEESADWCVYDINTVRGY